MSKYLPVFYIILGVLVGFLLFSKKPQIETKTVYDTVYVKQKPQIIYKTAIVEKVVIDTLIQGLASKDTIILKDTISVASDSVNFPQGKLATKYYFPPVNIFRYDWRPFPEKTIIKKETIVIKPKWYERKELWGISGLIIGVFLNR